TMSTSRRHGGSRLSRRSLLGGAAAVIGSFGFPAVVKAQAETIRAGHLTPRTGFLGLKEVSLPTIPPGQIVGLMRNTMGNVRYSSGGQNLNQLRAQSGSNDFFNGAGGVLDTDRDVYTVGIPGGD